MEPHLHLRFWLLSRYPPAVEGLLGTPYEGSDTSLPISSVRCQIFLLLWATKRYLHSKMILNNLFCTNFDIICTINDSFLFLYPSPLFPPSRTPPGSLDHHSPPHNISPQYQPLFGQYDSNFPLRKTASDSNLKVRSRLKEKVAERRSHGSPLLPRRRDGLSGSLKQRKPLNGKWKGLSKIWFGHEDFDFGLRWYLLFNYVIAQWRMQGVTAKTIGYFICKTLINREKDAAEIRKLGDAN